MGSGRIAGFGGQPISFSFDGKPYQGLKGDTIASALLANSLSIIGRSFKYHRPRGIFGFGAEEPNALFDCTLEGLTTPNLRATTEALQEGMVLRSVNTRPDAQTDRNSFLDCLSAFIPAGFYYKTFLWPDWHMFEPRIRAMAGLGRLDPHNQPMPENAQIAAECDVLVVGAGPAGLLAAREAAHSGKTIILVDAGAQAGGSLLHDAAVIDGMDGAQWADGIVSDLRENGQRVLPQTIAYGIYDHNLVCLWERRVGKPDRQWRVRADQIILAAGAIERPLVFADNDRPGILSAQAGLYYLKRHGVLVGRRIVLVSNNDQALSIAPLLREAGAEVTLVDLRDGKRIEQVHYRRKLEGVTISGTRHEADCLLVSGGYTPTIHLHAQAGGKLAYDESIASFRPRERLSGLVAIGAANGTFALSKLLREASIAGGGDGTIPQIDLPERGTGIQAMFPEPGSSGRQWIDFQNDVTLKDIELAARENFKPVEHLKRYTTLGMANDQGKTSNMNGLAALASLTNRSIPDVGTTTYRPPFIPVPLPIIGGKRRAQFFNPLKRLVLERVHREEGAVFREYGGWLRPAFYGGGDARETIQREALAARQGVALMDGSPLGKIELVGPDAGALADFNSYHRISSLRPGRMRYGFMLTERGVLYDDGVTAKISDQHYVISCSSGHVEGVAARLEELRQDQFDPSRVFIHDQTAQWATLIATGPRSRELVALLNLGAALDDASLPHMSFANGQFAGGPARISRVSFTGDRSYEISVPAGHADALYRQMRDQGEALGLTLLGSEALLLLRAEKGYLIAGKDSDGTTMPHDLGVAGPREKRKDDYIGRRSLFTDEAKRDSRAQLVGLTVEGSAQLPTGAHAIETKGGKRRSIGFVTSSYHSPHLQRPIALGLIENGLSRMGESIELFHLGQIFQASIAPACCFDMEGERLNA